MRKSRLFSLMMVLVMLCILFSSTLVFAEPQQSNTDLYYVKIVQPSVMIDTHELWDSTLTVKGPNGEDSVKLSKDNGFGTGGWLLKFNIGKFAEGDEITITHSGDSTIFYTDSDNNNEALAPFKVVSVDDGYLGDNNEWVEDIHLQGTETSPKTLWILKDFKDEARISFKDMNGKALTGVKITLVSFSGMFQNDYVTDENGYIFVKASEFDSAKVYFTDGHYAFYKGKADDGTISAENFGVVSHIDPGVYREFVACANVREATEDAKDIDYSVKLTEARPLLLNLQGLLTLTFEGNDTSFDTKALYLGDNTVKVSEGTYTVSSKSEGFKIPQRDNVNTNVPLNLSIDTTHTLKVSDESAPTNTFIVENIKSLTGQSFAVNKEYGVLPGETLMLRNTATNKVYSVSIDNEYTEINLANGEITGTDSTGNKTAAKTADSVTWIILFIILALIALGVCIFLYIKNKGNLKPPTGTQTLALLLAITLLSALCPVNTFAANNHTINYLPGYGSGSHSATGGNLQSGSSLIKLSLIENTISEAKSDSATEWDLFIRGSADVSQLATAEKFKFEETAVYLATNADTYYKALNGGTFTIDRYWWADGHSRDNVALAQWGKSYASGDYVGTEWHDWYVRLLPMFWSGNMGNKEMYDDGRLTENTDADVAYFLRWLYNYFAGRDPEAGFGSDLHTYALNTIDTVDGVAGYSEDELANRQREEQQLIYGWINYLLNYGQIDGADVDRLKTAYKQGRLAILVESCPGFYYVGGDRNTEYYVTTHDFVTMCQWARPEKWGGVDYEVRAVPKKHGSAGQWTVHMGYSEAQCFCTGGDHYNAGKCVQFKHMPFSGIMAITNNNLKAINPTGDNVDINNNPFGGWGYITVGYDDVPQEPKTPGVWATFFKEFYDAQGNLIPQDTMYGEVPGWGKAELGIHTLQDINDWEEKNVDSTIFIPTVVFDDNGECYQLVPKSGVMPVQYTTTTSQDDNNTVVSYIGSIGLAAVEYEWAKDRVNELLDYNLLHLLNALYKNEAYPDVDGGIVADYSKELFAMIDEIATAIEAQYPEIVKDSSAYREHYDNYYFTADGLDMLTLNKLGLFVSAKESIKAKVDQKTEQTFKFMSDELVDVQAQKNYVDSTYTMTGYSEAKRCWDAAEYDWNLGTYTYDIREQQENKLRQLGSYLSKDSELSMYYGTDNYGNVLLIFPEAFSYKWIPDPDPEDPNKKPEDPGIKTSITGDGVVPQWRINKYWESIVPLLPQRIVQQSILKLGYSSDDSNSHANSYFTTALLKPYVKNYGDVPFLSEPKMKSGLKTQNKHIDSITADVWGDLMAYKDGNVDALTTAVWVNSTPKKATYKTFDIDASEGSDKQFGDNFVSYSADNNRRLCLSYYFEPVNDITHYRAIRYHTKKRCRCSTEAEKVTLTQAKTADYGLDMLFKCYNQKKLTPQSFTDTRNETDGFTEFTQQSPKTMRLYAEVPMLFTDVAHNNSIRFVTADRATEVQPISYHTLQYSTKIVPTISGIAATDSKAKAKLAEMGLVDPDFEAQMLNKGSATTTSYDVQGKLTAKTYALDINQSRYKNAWKSNDYTAQGVNDEFLAGFASAQPDGSYTANIDMTENLKINNQSYGNVKNTVTVKANNVNVKEYKLIVRAGEITSIEGHTDWQTRYPELADVLLNKMKANHAGVFSVFNSGDGDVLDEPEFARLAGMLREDSPSIAEGKGWYSEDTTLISLYEYTTDFNLVGSQFSNKIPSSIAGLESPQNKQLFYNTAYEGHLTLDFDLQAVDARCKTPLHYETSSDKWSNKVYKLYAVPNVSVQDTTN